MGGAAERCDRTGGRAALGRLHDHDTVQSEHPVDRCVDRIEVKIGAGNRRRKCYACRLLWRGSSGVRPGNPRDLELMRRFRIVEERNRHDVAFPDAEHGSRHARLVVRRAEGQHEHRLTVDHFGHDLLDREVDGDRSSLRAARATIDEAKRATPEGQRDK